MYYFLVCEIRYIHSRTAFVIRFHSRLELPQFMDIYFIVFIDIGSVTFTLEECFYKTITRSQLGFQVIPQNSNGRMHFTLK